MRPGSIAALMVVLVVAASISNAALITNPRFESGDLTGWHVSGWGGTYYDKEGTPVEYPFMPEANPFFARGPSVRAAAAADGAYGLYLESWQGGGGSFTAPDGESYWFESKYYGVTVEQSVWLDSGETLNGWARFGSEDGSPWHEDFARVSIDGLQLWGHDCGEFSSLSSQYRWMPWEQWTFTAPSSGTYAIEFSVYGDDQFNTYACFDTGMPVSDPTSTLFLLSLACAGIVGLRRRLSP